MGNQRLLLQISARGDALAYQGGGRKHCDGCEISGAGVFNRSIGLVPFTPEPRDGVALLTAKLRLRNTAQPITLNFLGGQSFDFTITNDKGAIVYRWPDGQAFTWSSGLRPSVPERLLPVQLGNVSSQPGVTIAVR